MKRNNRGQALALAVLGLIPVIWLGLLMAPAIAGGLPDILQNLTAALNRPLYIIWCEDSVKTVLFLIAAYGMGIGVYLSTRRNYRRREEAAAERVRRRA